MSGYDPNNPNNPWGNQGWNGQQGNQQGGQQGGQQAGQQQGGWQQPNQQQPTWEQQQQQQQQQPWAQPGQQQGQWDAQQQQQQWDQQQQWNQQQQGQQGQAQWDPAQQQWNQQQQQWGQPQAQAQSWDQQQQWNQGQAQQPAQSWEQQQSQWSGVAGVSGGAAVADTSADVADSSGRSISGAVATLGADVRVTFIKKTYAHLAGAILMFLGLEWVFFKVPIVVEKFSAPFMEWSLRTNQNWAVVLVSFMAVSWLADKWASSSTSRGTQYFGLLFYTIAEAITFVPLIGIAVFYLKAPEIPQQGFVVTLALFAGLTAVVFVTRKDFSFLKGALALGTMIALGMIVAAMVFGFSLGIVFSAAMCALAGGYILFYTSRVLAHYHPQQYVAAALALFSAFMLMLWYVIRILISLRR